jgi:hypothetical protein
VSIDANAGSPEDSHTAFNITAGWVRISVPGQQLYKESRIYVKSDSHPQIAVHP